MDIFKIVGIGLIGMLISIILKQYKPEIAIYSAIITGIIILIYILDSSSNIFDLIKELSQKAGLSNQYLAIILKITGIAYITELAVNICKDAGETAIASKIEMGSKFIIIAISIPIIGALLQIVNKIM